MSPPSTTACGPNRRRRPALVAAAAARLGLSHATLRLDRREARAPASRNGHAPHATRCSSRTPRAVGAPINSYRASCRRPGRDRADAARRGAAASPGSPACAARPRSAPGVALVRPLLGVPKDRPRRVLRGRRPHLRRRPRLTAIRPRPARGCAQGGTRAYAAARDSIAPRLLQARPPRRARRRSTRGRDRPAWRRLLATTTGDEAYRTDLAAARTAAPEILLRLLGTGRSNRVVPGAGDPPARSAGGDLPRRSATALHARARPHRATLGGPRRIALAADASVVIDDRPRHAAPPARPRARG